MKAIEEILENAAINQWTRHFRKSQDQRNRSHESDAELIALPGRPDDCLAVTIDTIVEEITLGLYRDPYTMGWITVMASLSDLAAVGAEPLGVLIAVSLRPECDAAFVAEVARGMEAACRLGNTYILGGDTNESASTSLTGCALGIVPRAKALSRQGCKAGDRVFITGGAGAGNALALTRLAGLADEMFPERNYRPVAAIPQGRIIREIASCGMDTSDGVLATLDQLMRINQVGFEIECDWERIIEPRALALCRRTGTPEWMMLAGPHGEFELIFTVPQDRVATLIKTFDAKEFPLIPLGRVIERCDLELRLPSGYTVAADMTPLRNLYATVGGDVQEYLRLFRETGKQWGVEDHG